MKTAKASKSQARLRDKQADMVCLLCDQDPIFLLIPFFGKDSIGDN